LPVGESVTAERTDVAFRGQVSVNRELGHEETFILSGGVNYNATYTVPALASPAPTPEVCGYVLDMCEDGNRWKQKSFLRDEFE
jgi:hypothetical protein